MDNDYDDKIACCWIEN